MSLSLPALKLFSLYPGGPTVQATGSLNGNSSFTIPATRFSAAYNVNMPGSSNSGSSATAFYALQGHHLATQTASELRDFNTPLSLVGRNLQQTSVPTVAPTIPNLYQNAVSLLSVSELTMADLLQQPSFKITGPTMGFKVTTDGAGNVVSESLSPTVRGSMPRADLLSDNFGRPNRAEITMGLMKKVDAGNGLGAFTAKQALLALKNNPQNSANALNATDTLATNPLTTGQTTLNGLQTLILNALQGQNTDLDSLTGALTSFSQTPNGEAPVPLTGSDAALNVDQSRQLAATQARLDVNPSDIFRENLTSLVGAASRQGESYLTAMTPKMDQVMNGRVNVMPWQSGTGASGGNLAFGGGGAFEMGAAVADAAARKGKGAMYIPMRMQGDGQPGSAMLSGGSGGGESGSNPFQGGMQSGMGFGGQQQQSGGQAFRPLRRPLVMMA